MPDKKLTTAQAHNAAQTGAIDFPKEVTVIHGDYATGGTQIAGVPQHESALGTSLEIRLPDSLMVAWAAPFPAPDVTCPDCGRNYWWWPLAIVDLNVDAVCVCQANKPVGKRGVLRWTGGVGNREGEWQLVGYDT